MLEQTLCLVCIREKGMKRIERTFNSSGIWISILKRRYNTLFPTNNANVGPNFESRNLILITRDWTTCDLRWGEVGVGTRSYNSKINGDWCASYYKYSNLLLIQNFLVLYSVQYYYYYAICGSILGMLTLISWPCSPLHQSEEQPELFLQIVPFYIMLLVGVMGESKLSLEFGNFVFK